MKTCRWCKGTFTSGGIQSAKYGSFCCRSHFASWKFYGENYCATIFRRLWPF